MKYPITPIGKPRMTQRDKWKKRDAVQRYYAFKDHANLLRIKIPESNAHIIFHVPMPKSWSQKKRDAMRGQPHQSRPDVDNFTKALLDSLFAEDSNIWDIRTTKLWSDDGAIEVIADKEVAA